MDGIGEQGLFIIAALVIAFINWLSGTLKKRKSAQHGDDEQSQAHHREASADALSHADHDSWPAPDDEQESAPLVASAPNPEPDDPNSEIREFFAALSGTPPVEAPPVPVMEVEEQAPPPPPTEPVHELPSNEGYHVVGSSRRSSQHPIIQKLLKEGGAREAFIFTQILGKPKALGENR